ncbi:MAG: hypothetical protein ACYTFQ_27985 [Planctomycetota bacterium]|jgi:hypothetical protein
MMYFLNGVLCGFLTGVTITAVQADPSIGVVESNKRRLVQVQAGFVLGIILGLGTFVGGVIAITRSL